jgi:hypothetical protein
MIDIPPATINPPGGTTPATSAADIVGGDELYVKVTGLTAANLADPTLQITMEVEGNNSASGNQGWYSASGVVDWHGGIQAKGQPVGTFAPCQFGFRNSAAVQ